MGQPRLLLSLAVCLSDAVIVYLATKEREAWVSGQIGRSIMMEALTAAAVGVSILLLSAFGWPLLIPSVIGAVIGRWLAWRY